MRRPPDSKTAGCQLADRAPLRQLERQVSICVQRLQQTDGALQRMQSNDEATNQRLDKIERVLASNAHSMNAKQTQILELLSRTALGVSGGPTAAAPGAGWRDGPELRARPEKLHAGGDVYDGAASSVSILTHPYCLPSAGLLGAGAGIMYHAPGLWRVDA